MADRPARTPTQLQYLMWDGTDPVDSITLAKGLAKSFRCINLLDDCPAGEFGVRDTPKIFEPCGKAGTDITDDLWILGMFGLPRVFFKPVHQNKGDDLPAILQFSGHGIPGYMFSNSSVLIAASRAMTATRDPAIKASLNWNFVDVGWDNPSTKVVIFSACRQLAGLPQQFHWSNRMRGASNRVHIILSYRNTAPDAGTSSDINKAFISNLAAGQTFINAWRGGHGGGLRKRWAALAFKSSVNDRMDHWVRDGSLPAEPAADEDVLYFDEDNRTGRVVTKPKPDFSMAMTFVSGANVFPVLFAGNIVPPWTILRRGTQVNVNVAFITDTFNDGDKVWLGLVQVRPDYAGPFEIETALKFPNQDALIDGGTIKVRGRLHDESAHPKDYPPDGYGDVYEFIINRKGMSFATLDSTFAHLTVPMVIGDSPNDHLAIFYMMARVERDGKEFGIPTDLVKGIRIANQKKLVEQAQFCVFHIFGTAS